MGNPSKNSSAAAYVFQRDEKKRWVGDAQTVENLFKQSTGVVQRKKMAFKGKKMALARILIKVFLVEKHG